ncbi:hypothetical protein F4055_14755 [Candidatus Poribacteria bacterium]|nr:hypothetical protein [Candidatus Poribacteria bacterium]
MSIREAAEQLTVDHLLDGVQQLTPAELWEFTERFAEWQRQRELPEEATLLASIRENSRLPEEEQRRYQELAQVRECNFERGRTRGISKVDWRLRGAKP